MKKQDLIAELIGGTRKEADQFIQRVNVALPERATFSEILHVLNRLPPEKRKPEEVIVALGGNPQAVRPSVAKQPIHTKPEGKPQLKPKATPVVTLPAKPTSMVTSQTTSTAKPVSLRSGALGHFDSRKERTPMATNTIKAGLDNMYQKAIRVNGKNAAAQRLEQRFNAPAPAIVRPTKPNVVRVVAAEKEAAQRQNLGLLSCPKCGLPFKRESDLKEHTANWHPQNSGAPSEITGSDASWWYQQIRAANNQGGPREIHTNIVGVTYENRQAVVAQLTVGEQVWLRREPQNPYDSNAIRVERQNGQQIGYLSREFAASLAPQFDEYGKPVPAFVTNIVGGTYASSALGVRIRFAVPDIAPRSLPTVDDIDDYYDL